jgi:hypothetical protein
VRHETLSLQLLPPPLLLIQVLLLRLPLRHFLPLVLQQQRSNCLLLLPALRHFLHLVLQQQRSNCLLLLPALRHFLHLVLQQQRSNCLLLLPALLVPCGPPVRYENVPCRKPFAAKSSTLLL